MKFKLLTCLLILIISSTIAVAQTGKIAGRARDATTGDPLPGANVFLVGTTLGTVTDLEGVYTIINVPPGTYDLRASFVGYTQVTMANVRVNINLTTTVNFDLQTEAIAGGEVIIVAQAPVIQPDISANVANVSIEEIVNVPIAGVSEFINLQAGIEPGLSVRGSDFDELGFIVDGMSLRDGRDNKAFTGISYTAIEELQIQTGGFNAEYGNVRSGLVNVVTKRPRNDRYTLGLLFRFAPAQQKHFGDLPGLTNPDAYWIRPFLDPEVKYTGTEAGWDIYDQRQYPYFEGYDAIADNLNTDDDPSNDMTADELIEVFKYRHRKDFKVDLPDYVGDVTFGGPVPFIGRSLGNLRFLASYRQTQTAYIVPQQREKFEDYTSQLKFISDLSPNMRLTINGMYSEQYGMATSAAWGDGGIDTGNMPNYPWQNSGMVSRLDGNQRDYLFGWHRYNPTNIYRNMIGVEFTHTLSSKTFYKASLQRMSSEYSTNRGVARDTSTAVTIGNMDLDEAPWGWSSKAGNDFSGLRLMGHWGRPRDSSKVAIYTARFDLESQINPLTLVKGGVEFNVNDYNINAGSVNMLHTIQTFNYKWNRTPIQAAAYLQSKLEFQGMIANLGARLDIFDGNGTWYDHAAYERAFSAKVGIDQIDDVIEQNDIKTQVFLSPRMGVAFPITINSKLFFNYGHFRQINNPMNIFSIRSEFLGHISEVGNPDMPMPRTIAYELGYEHNIADMFLLRLSGYYKDISEQSRLVRFVSLDHVIDYEKEFPYNYSDVRGFEITFEKKRLGGWYRGFINYTYMARSQGDFGEEEHYENMAEQREYLRKATVSQNAFIPEPYGRFNIEFFTPPELGPKLGSSSLLGDWAINFLGEYRSGLVYKWTGDVEMPALDENMKWKDFYNLDLRFTKHFNTSFGDVQLFIDVSNVLNLRYMHRTIGFEGDYDEDYYYASLHLPEDTFGEYSPPFEFIPGDDRPGDYRKPGVEYVPIEIVREVTQVGDPYTRPLYYETATKNYMQWDGAQWKKADQGFVDKVLKDKAYIDMPNESYYTFLNPRAIQFGVRLSF